MKAILFDTDGVLYHRPRQDQHLRAFLAAHGLSLRHRDVLAKALRAAWYDAMTGRITRKELFDGILRINGLENPVLFPAGREAIYRDAIDIDLFPGVADTLHQLRTASLLLGAVSDTVHSANEKKAWLVARGVSPGIWRTFIVSSDVGSTKEEPAIFHHALTGLNSEPENTAFVGHKTAELCMAKELGLTTIAFLPDEYGVPCDHCVGSFYELGELFLGSMF